MIQLQYQPIRLRYQATGQHRRSLIRSNKKRIALLNMRDE